MESKKLLIILVLIVLIGGGLIYYYQNGFSFPFLEENTPAEENTPDGNNGTEEPEEEADTVLERNSFSILLPAGWKEIVSPEGISLMIIKNQEEFSDLKVKDIGFQSYVAVSLGDSKEKTWEEYIDFTRESVLGMLGQDSRISSEGDATINGKQAYTMDFEATYGGVELKGQVVIVKAEGTNVWGMSFNTTKDKWEGYKDVFSRVAESFEIK